MKKAANYNKQILYPDTFSRIISSLIDLLIISVLFTPISYLVKWQYLMPKLNSALTENDVDINNSEAFIQFIQSSEAASQYGSEFFSAMLFVFMVNFLLPLLIYFVSCWYYLGSTPAKYLLSMRIVDEDTLKRPKLINLIWRFIGYSCFFLGIWMIPFTKKKQAFHDKLGKTIVISA